MARRTKDRELPIVYSCSGCSSAAQMANHIALQLDRSGIAEPYSEPLHFILLGALKKS